MNPSMISQPCKYHQPEEVGWPAEESHSDPLPALLAAKSGVVRRKLGRGSPGSAQEATTSSTFPYRLHNMLNDAEKQKFDHIISWQGPNGFIIHDRTLLEKFVLPRYYLQTRYKSFTRQLTMYGFVRTTHTPSKKGAYSHTFLRRGTPDLCQFMVRTKIKSLLPSKSNQIPTTTDCKTTCGTIPDKSLSCPSTTVSATINNSIILKDQKSIMADFTGREEMLYQRLDAVLRAPLSRIHRRSSLSGSVWSATSNNNKMINATMDGLVACIDPNLTYTNPEISRHASGVFDKLESFEFEPMDPFETSLEPAFAEDLVRIFNLM